MFENVPGACLLVLPGRQFHRRSPCPLLPPWWPPLPSLSRLQLLRLRMDTEMLYDMDWCYVILKGAIWRIEPAPDGYMPADENELEILTMLGPEHHSDSK